MSQILIGDLTENDVIEIFKNHNYWVYNFPHKINGQPVDIVAIKGKPDMSWLVDVKHVREKDVSFTFNRIEANQESSMLYCKNFANLTNLGFVIKFERTKEFYYLSFDTYCEFRKKGFKSVNLNDLELFENKLTEEENAHKD